MKRFLLEGNQVWGGERTLSYIAEDPDPSITVSEGYCILTFRISFSLTKIKYVRQLILENAILLRLKN